MIKRRIPIDEAKDRRKLSKGEQSELRSLRTQHNKDMVNGRYDLITKKAADHKAIDKPKDRSQQMHTALTVMHTAFAQDAKKAQHKQTLASIDKTAKTIKKSVPSDVVPSKDLKSSREDHLKGVYNDAHRNATLDFSKGKIKLSLLDRIKGRTVQDIAHAHAKKMVEMEKEKQKLTKEEIMSEENKNETEVEKVEQEEQPQQPSVMDRYASFISGQAKKLEYSTFGHNRTLNKEDTLHETKWEFEDARGVKTKGTYVKSVEGQGTDVTYHFKDDKGKLHLVSGARLKKAKRIK